MNRIHFGMILFLLVSIDSHAQNSAIDAAKAGIDLVLHYSQESKKMDSPVQKDEVAGCCFFRGTSLRLENSTGTIIQEQTLSDEVFKFSNLKPGIYAIVANHPKLPSPQKLTHISTGIWTDVKFPETKALPSAK